MRKPQWNSDTFKSWFLVLEAVLDRHDSIKPFISSSIYLLTRLLNIFGAKEIPSKLDLKPWGIPCQNQLNQMIAFLIPKMKAFVIAHIRS